MSSMDLKNELTEELGKTVFDFVNEDLDRELCLKMDFDSYYFTVDHLYMEVRAAAAISIKGATNEKLQKYAF